MSTSFRIVITEPGETDLRDIVNDIANEWLDPAAARKVLANISEAAIQLETMPLRYGLVRDGRLAAQGIRKWLLEPYIVFYTVSEREATVAIIRILYGKRNWNSLL